MESLKSKVDADPKSEIDAVASLRSSPHYFIPNLSQRILCELNSELNSDGSMFTLDLLQPSTGVLNA